MLANDYVKMLLHNIDILLFSFTIYEYPNAALVENYQ